MIEKRHWHVEVLPSARRKLLTLRTPIQDQIRAAMNLLANDPTPADAIAMRGKGAGLYQLRVGRYRVVYRIQNERLCILVIRIGHRSEVYRGWEG